MKSIKKALDYIFIDGLSGMAMGLFATLIIGTILDQIAGFINHPIGAYMAACAAVAKSLTGAGIGVGMAFKYNTSPLAGVSAAVAGMAQVSTRMVSPDMGSRVIWTRCRETAQKSPLAAMSS